MIIRAAARALNDENEEPPDTLTRFMNCNNVGMTQHNLVHQFKEQGYPDVTFASGTTQALFVRESLYNDSNTPSNFTIFAYHKQEPNSDKHQNDYLICHLLQVEGQKKLLDEIKASHKQAVHVPTKCNKMGIQIQLFTAASGIFFGNESILTSSLRQLLINVCQNKR
jgi:hypothetical protein